MFWIAQVTGMRNDIVIVLTVRDFLMLHAKGFAEKVPVFAFHTNITLSAILFTVVDGSLNTTTLQTQIVSTAALRACQNVHVLSTLIIFQTIVNLLSAFSSLLYQYVIVSALSALISIVIQFDAMIN